MERNHLYASRIQCHGVGPAQLSAAALTALSGAFDVEFVSSESGSDAAAEAMVLWGGDAEEVLKRCPAKRVLVIPGEATQGGPSIETIEICGEIPGKPWLRGHSLKLPKPTRIMPFVAMAPGAEVMARSSAGPVWVRETVGDRMIDRVAWSLPAPAAGRAVFEWFHAGTFALWLPLLQFVREVTGEYRWQTPIKACFMFDDPNLHARSYGFLRYAELTKHARQFGYHASFATIPLDGWYVDPAAAALFRENREQLSLLIHGNDHVLRELAQEYSDEARRALVGQALRRIQRLEAKSGVEVCRVMAAPHGACSEAMMGEMARFGFEAASISHGSLRHYNSTQEWSQRLGCRPTEIIAGLPVIPRFPMKPDVFQESLFAAYLDQPIIPMGHHQDVAPGVGFLDAMASQINRLGSVHWRRMGEISKTHYQWRLEGQTFVVRPFSHLLRLEVPEAATQLRLELPTRNGLDSNRYGVKRATGERREFAATEAVAVTPGETVWLDLVAGERLDPNDVPSPRWKLKPILRRLACEARERMRQANAGWRRGAEV